MYEAQIDDAPAFTRANVLDLVDPSDVRCEAVHVAAGVSDVALDVEDVIREADAMSSIVVRRLSTLCDTAAPRFGSFSPRAFAS